MKLALTALVLFASGLAQAHTLACRIGDTSVAYEIKNENVVNVGAAKDGGFMATGDGEIAVAHNGKVVYRTNAILAQGAKVLLHFATDGLLTHVSVLTAGRESLDMSHHSVNAYLPNLKTSHPTHATCVSR